MTDDAIIRWLDSRFDQLQVQIEHYASLVAKLEDNHRRCRDHCEKICKETDDRLERLEGFEMRQCTAENIQDKLRAEFDLQDDRRIQAQQAFWMKMAAVVALAVGSSTLLSGMLAHYWIR
jgi:hypothetical protein